MVYDLYEDEKKFDLLIPIAIIVLVAIIFLGKTTTLMCGIPVVNTVLCPGGQEIRIAVLGTLGDDSDTIVTSSQMKKWFDGEYGAIYSIYYVEYAPEAIKFLGDQLLTDYDLVILSGNREYMRPVKDAVEDYLSKGGKVLLVGDAAVTDPDDNAAIGWGKMGMPVKLKGYVATEGMSVPTIELDPYTLQFATISHPILEVFEGMVRIESNAFNDESCKSHTFIQVDPKSAKTIAFVTGDDTEGKEKFLPAIVETDSALGGKVVYFAFDPGCSVNMLISTVKYLSGK